MAELNQTLTVSVNKDNNASRIISSFFPYEAYPYRQLFTIVRVNGVWCSCGGSAQSVTLSGYDQLIDTSTGVVIKQSDTGTCGCHGTGPASENYMTTTFSNFTSTETQACIAAWKNGTLQIKRTVWVSAYSSSGHGSPTFRDGYYNDTIQIIGDTAPATNYGPKIDIFELFRDLNTDGTQSDKIVLTVRLSMNDASEFDSRNIILHAQENDISGDWTLISLNEEYYFDIDLGVTKKITLSDTYNIDNDYYFYLSFTVGEEYDVSDIYCVTKASVPIHISQTNNGVAVGQFSTATKTNPKFESQYPVYPYSGIQICEGGAFEIPLTFDDGSSFGLYSENSFFGLRAYGNLVQLYGEITPTKDITGSTTHNVIATLPNKYAPPAPIVSLHQGTGQAIWMLTAFPETDSEYPCKITFARYRQGASYASCAVGNWLPFSTMWIAGMRPTILEPEITYIITRPVLAMTSNSSQNCEVSASSVYNSSYDVYKAFNKSYSDQYGWAAETGVNSAWIQIKMDIALSDITVVIINRTYTYVNGPQSGTIQGSNDGVTWTTIGSFEGRDGETSGHVTRHECENVTPYSYVRLNVSRDKDLIAIGEIYVEGKEASAVTAMLGTAVLGQMVLGGS